VRRCRKTMNNREGIVLAVLALLLACSHAFVHTGVLAPPRPGAAPVLQRVQKCWSGEMAARLHSPLAGAAQQPATLRARDGGAARPAAGTDGSLHLGSWVQSDAEVASFTSAFTGEWVGYEADFTPDGSVVHVPEVMCEGERGRKGGRGGEREGEEKRDSMVHTAVMRTPGACFERRIDVVDRWRPVHDAARAGGVGRQVKRLRAPHLLGCAGCSRVP